MTAGTLSGEVLCGSRNIFTVQLNDPGSTGLPVTLECRIKGKILKGREGFYNPLAPGDRVKLEADPLHPGTGMIIALEERTNFFSRFNQKGGCTQLLAANVDQVFCMTTRVSPPFRPRFVDRVLAQADIAGIPACIVCNKNDLDSDDIDIEERLEDFRRIGFKLIKISAKTGEGLDELRRHLAGKSTVLVGQSCVGKSSLIKALKPELAIKTGAMNEKYDRGNHTTTLAITVELAPPGGAAPGGRIIDTPGIRRFVPDGIAASQLILHMREFAPLAGTCSFGLSCSHRVEPGCKILEAISAGVIHEDRYNSYVRIFDELAGNNHAD